MPNFGAKRLNEHRIPNIVLTSLLIFLTNPFIVRIFNRIYSPEILIALTANQFILRSSEPNQRPLGHTL
jgi:hypothetical protein